MAKQASSSQYHQLNIRTPCEHGGLRLYDVGFHGRNLHPQMHPHWMRKHWGLVLLTDGLGFCESATMPYRELRPGDCVICVPTLWHNYGPQPGKWWEDYYLFFDGPMLTGLAAAGRMPRQQRVLHPGLGDHILAGFRQAVTAVADGDLPRASEAAFTALARVLASAPVPEPGALPHPMVTVAERLMADPAGDWSFPDLAGEHGMTYAGFRRAFRRHFGLSPGAWLNRERMHLACRLLQEDKPISAVSRQVGMTNALHFSRRFKAHFGASPRTYIRDLRAKNLLP